MTKLQYNAETGTYEATLPDGTEVEVKADIYDEQENEIMLGYLHEHGYSFESINEVPDALLQQATAYAREEVGCNEAENWLDAFPGVWINGEPNEARKNQAQAEDMSMKEWARRQRSER